MAGPKGGAAPLTWLHIVPNYQVKCKSWPFPHALFVEAPEFYFFQVSITDGSLACSHSCYANSRGLMTKPHCPAPGVDWKQGPRLLLLGGEGL